MKNEKPKALSRQPINKARPSNSAAELKLSEMLNKANIDIADLTLEISTVTYAKRGLETENELLREQIEKLKEQVKKHADIISKNKQQTDNEKQEFNKRLQQRHSDKPMFINRYEQPYNRQPFISSDTYSALEGVVQEICDAIIYSLESRPKMQDRKDEIKHLIDKYESRHGTRVPLDLPVPDIANLMVLIGPKDKNYEISYIAYLKSNIDIGGIINFDMLYNMYMIQKYGYTSVMPNFNMYSGVNSNLYPY